MGKPEIMPIGYYGWNLLAGESGHVTLKNVLHNLSARENGDSHEYSQGILCGVVSTLIACGMEFDDAIQMVRQHLPKDVHPERITKTWEDLFN